MTRGGARALVAVFALVAVIALASLCEGALAQVSPFGGARPPAPRPEVGGLTGWLLAQQAQFYRALSGLVRSAKADGSAVWALLGMSFLYGVFHAAGPGHGKAVISSYLVANEETWRRGIALSFASALLQAMVAVAIVSVAALALNATAKTMNETVRVIEIVSYALIALVGARLTWTKGAAFIRVWRERRRERTALAGAAAHERAHHDHAHAGEAPPLHQEHAHAGAMAHAHAGGMPQAAQNHAAHDHHAIHGHVAHDPAHRHTHAHVHDGHCGHSHGPAPADLAGRAGWRRGLAAIFAVGLRPCSGAILVLVFALAQGLFWAGVASTFAMGLGTAITVAAIATFAVAAKSLAKRIALAREGGGVLVMRGIELAAAALVLVFGAALLTGYIVTERMI